jgi:hypothetical protein
VEEVVQEFPHHIQLQQMVILEDLVVEVEQTQDLVDLELLDRDIPAQLFLLEEIYLPAAVVDLEEQHQILEQLVVQLLVIQNFLVLILLLLFLRQLDLDGLQLLVQGDFLVVVVMVEVVLPLFVLLVVLDQILLLGEMQYNILEVGEEVVVEEYLH